MIAASIPYDPEQARDLASAISQIVPVLLLATLAVPVLQARNAPVLNDPQAKRRALRHLIATVLALGLSAITEFGALFGVYYRLSERDVRFVVGSFTATFLVSSARVLMPIVEHYADQLEEKEWQMWIVIVVGALIVSYGSVRLVSG